MVRFRMRAMFFDRKAVRDRVDKATRRVLSRFGAYVRTAARSSIRKRRRVSAPGSPPSSHTGLLKRFIFFGFDPGKRSVVIGPERLESKAGNAPRLLEYGGPGVVEEDGRRRRVTYRARPFMGPALAREEPKLPAMWKDSVK